VIRPGLTSVTFRRLSRAEVVSRAAAAGLEGIEWGGDIHVPPANQAAAAEAVRLCRDAGLAIPSYGSYHRLGVGAPDEWSRVLDTARALGARTIRVWAGNKGSAEADDKLRGRVAEAGRAAAEQAAAAGLRVACEWHADTLTDTAASAEALLAAVGHPAFGNYWQPRNHMPFADCLRDLQAALPRLMGLHVFHLHPATRERLPLADGAACWNAYLRAAAAAVAGDEIFAHLEFLRDDGPARLPADAAALKGMLARLIPGRTSGPAR
jgi:3-dehydroshikimate dehydratase